VERTKINWANSTFNPWQGCTWVSAGCDNCYAKRQDARRLHGDKETHWGTGAARKLLSEANWLKPLAWNRKAGREGTRPRVFCASMADWADKDVPEGQRDRLWETIQHTPNLDWLLLTKRAPDIRKYLPAGWGKTGYANCWLGVSVENRKKGVPRIDKLRKVPASVRFLSVEPLLEDLGPLDLSGIHWVIIGGETGPGARSMDTGWVRSILSQCKDQGVPAWLKQLGRSPTHAGKELVLADAEGKRSSKGEDFDIWPKGLGRLKVRQLPITNA
jgi:protein gp37